MKGTAPLALLLWQLQPGPEGWPWAAAAAVAAAPESQGQVAPGPAWGSPALLQPLKGLLQKAGLRAAAAALQLLLLALLLQRPVPQGQLGSPHQAGAPAAGSRGHSD